MSDVWHRRPGLTTNVARSIPALLRIVQTAPPKAQHAAYPAARFLFGLYCWYHRKDKDRPPIDEVLRGTWRGCEVCGNREFEPCACFGDLLFR